MTLLPSEIRFQVGQRDLSGVDNLKLVISDITPGGCDTCTFEYCPQTIGDMPKLADRVIVRDVNLNRTVWLGRLEEPDIDYNSKNGDATRFTARGYKEALSDRKFIARQVYSTAMGVIHGPSMYDMIVDAVRRQCPDIYGIDFVDPDIFLDDDSQDYGGQTAQQVIESLLVITSRFTTPFSYWVREDTNAPYFATLYITSLDPAARYTTILSPDVTLRGRYALNSIINEAIVEWGHDQYETAPTSGVPGLSGPISYAAIPIIRSKTVNVSSDVHAAATARSIADSTVVRFNQLRIVNGTLELCGGTIRAIPPVTPTVTSLPLWLFRSGYTVGIAGIDPKFTPYIHNTPFVTRTEYEFDTGKCTATLGEIQDIGTAVADIQSTLTYQPLVPWLYGATSNPLLQTELLPAYGPDFDPNHTRSYSMSGSLGMVKDDTLPLKAVVHPDLIADEGIEINYAFDITEVGWKGGTWSIPGKIDEIKISLFAAAAANGLQPDSITFGIYTRPANTNPVLWYTAIVSGQQEVVIQVPVNQQIIFTNKDTQVVFKVEVAGTLAEVACVSLHGKKHYPGLNV